MSSGHYHQRWACKSAVKPQHLSTPPGRLISLELHDFLYTHHCCTDAFVFRFFFYSPRCLLWLFCCCCCYCFLLLLLLLLLLILFLTVPFAFVPTLSFLFLLGCAQVRFSLIVSFIWLSVCLPVCLSAYLHVAMLIENFMRSELGNRSRRLYSDSISSHQS